MTVLSSYAQRFKQLRKAVGLNQQEFGDKLEITQSSVSQIESGKNLPSTSILEKLVEIFPKINKQWLYHGEGEMFLDSIPPSPSTPRMQGPGVFTIGGDSPLAQKEYQRLQAENDMLRSRISLIEETNDDLYKRRRDLERENDQLRTEKDSVKSNVVERTITEKVYQPIAITVDAAGQDNILMVTTKAAAGYMQGCVEKEYLQNLPAFTIPSMEFRNGTFRAFQVNGQSMEPTLRTGDWLICEFTEKLKDIKNGDMYVIVSDTRESVVVKRVDFVEEKGKLYLQSDNSLFPTYSIKVTDVKEVWKLKAHLNMQPARGFLHSMELELAKMKDELRDLQRQLR